MERSDDLNNCPINYANLTFNLLNRKKRSPEFAVRSVKTVLHLRFDYQKLPTCTCGLSSADFPTIHRTLTKAGSEEWKIPKGEQRIQIAKEFF